MMGGVVSLHGGADYALGRFWAFEGTELLAKGFDILAMMIAGSVTALDAYALVSKEMQVSMEQDC